MKIGKRVELPFNYAQREIVAQDYLNDSIRQGKRLLTWCGPPATYKDKMRVGYQEWDADIKRLESARNTLGNNYLMVDAIMGTIRPAWTTDKAISRAKDLVDFNLRWLEEPVHPQNIKDKII